MAQATEDRRTLSVREAAEFLGLSVSTLTRFRRNGGGPAFTQPTPRIVRYLRSDLEAFAAQHRHGGEAVQ